MNQKAENTESVDSNENPENTNQQQEVETGDDVPETAAESASEQTQESVSGESDELSSLSHDELMDRLNESLDQISEMKDGYLRAKAEMENVRRRSENEIATARKFAIEGFAKEILTVKDSLDQAANVELDESTDEAVSKMKEGLALTLKQLEAAMGKFGVEEVEADAGVRFDPEIHQAISMVPTDEVESNHIVSVMQKGFTLKSRLLRPAMVVVSQ